jgi:hypothetical protein
MTTVFEMLPVIQANDEAEVKTNTACIIQKKVPIRIIHCSDGIIEQFRRDEDEPDTSAHVTGELDLNTLPWGPWICHLTASIGSKILKVCNYLGEHLSRFFGILTPVYQYEIDEHKKIEAEKKEDERQRERNLEVGGWTGTPEETMV